MSTADSTPGSGTVLLEAVGLGKRFGARTTIVGLNLRVAAGELVVLAGANGCGKSTALRLLAGLLQADTGRCLVLGRDAARLDCRTRNAVGFLPQRQALYSSLSLFENLRFRAAVAGLPQPAARARQVLRELDLGGREHELLGHLSGGWIRQVEIAATLIHAPQLLLLDEPTTGLDAASRERIWRQLEDQRARGAAVLFSSHDPGELKRASCCITLTEPDNAR